MNPEFDVSDYSILTWLAKNQIKNERGELLDYSDRPFLLDILSDWNPNICIKKSAQVGGSVSFNLKVLFAVSKLGLHSIYTFPTDSDVQEFVASKTNKLIQQNPQVFKGLSSDNIERKELNGAFVYFKGTISKTAAIATTADILIHDEVSRSDQKTLQTYQSRTKASKYKGSWLFSNPTTERDALDLAWHKSDQKEWTVTCPACLLEQHLIWPDNIDLVRKIRCCASCKAEITRKELIEGKWVAQKPNSTRSGYHITLLMAPWVSAEEIITDSEGDQEYFHNFILGEPYNPGDLSVSRSTILDLWTPKSLETGNYFIGVDVGNIKHYTLGSEKGAIKVGKFSDWKELDDLLAFYKPVAGVIDAMPDNTMARYYVNTYPQLRMSFFQENTANPQTIVWNGEGDRSGIVYSNRNRAIDQMIDDMINARFLFALASDKEFREFIKHWETMRRVKVTNNRGIESYEWDSTTGVDHYVFSTLYYRIAVMTAGAGSAMTGGNHQVSAILHKSDGDYMNLIEAMASKFDE